MASPKTLGHLGSHAKPFSASPRAEVSNIPLSSSSLSSSLSTSFHSSKAEGKECHICGEKFGKLSNLKKDCTRCHRAVCKTHSLKKKELGDSQKLQRLCDLCDEELIKDEIRVEMEAQISDMETDIKTATEENDRRSRENRDKISILNSLEHEIAQTEKMHRQKVQTLQERLIEEQQKSEKARSTIEKLQRNLEDSHKSETVMAETCKTVDKQIEDLNTETQTLRERKEELTRHLQELEARIKSSVPLSQLKSVACVSCRMRLDNMYKPRKSAQGPTPDLEASVSFRPSPPAKQSAQTTRSCKSDCIVM